MNRGLSILVFLSACFAMPASAQKVSKKKSDALETSEKKAKGVFKPDSAKEEKIKFDDAKIDKIVAAKQARLSQVRLRQIEKMRGILRKNPFIEARRIYCFASQNESGTKQNTAICSHSRNTMSATMPT